MSERGRVKRSGSSRTRPTAAASARDLAMERPRPCRSSGRTADAGQVRSRRPGCRTASPRLARARTTRWSSRSGRRGSRSRRRTPASRRPGRAGRGSATAPSASIAGVRRRRYASSPRSRRGPGEHDRGLRKRCRRGSGSRRAGRRCPSRRRTSSRARSAGRRPSSPSPCRAGTPRSRLAAGRGMTTGGGTIATLGPRGAAAAACCRRSPACRRRSSSRARREPFVAATTRSATRLTAPPGKPQVAVVGQDAGAPQRRGRRGQGGRLELGQVDRSRRRARAPAEVPRAGTPA